MSSPSGTHSSLQPPSLQHEPQRCITGFQVVSKGHQSDSLAKVTPLPRRAPSLLHIHLSTSPISSCHSFEEDTDAAEEWSDDEEQSASPGALKIIQK